METLVMKHVLMENLEIDKILNAKIVTLLVDYVMHQEEIHVQNVQPLDLKKVQVVF